jgi:hypothetical protein
MITPSTPLEHILQLHVSTLRPVLGNIEWKHIHDLNTWPPTRLSRYTNWITHPIIQPEYYIYFCTRWYWGFRSGHTSGVLRESSTLHHDRRIEDRFVFRHQPFLDHIYGVFFKLTLTFRSPKRPTLDTSPQWRVIVHFPTFRSAVLPLSFDRDKQQGISCVCITNKKRLVNNPAPTETLWDIQCCGKEYELLTNCPHRHDRRWTLCGKDPELHPVCWKSTLVLHPPPWPDEDLSLLVSETYSDSLPVSNTEWG